MRKDILQEYFSFLSFISFLEKKIFLVVFEN